MIRLDLGGAGAGPGRLASIRLSALVAVALAVAAALVAAPPVRAQEPGAAVAERPAQGKAPGPAPPPARAAGEEKLEKQPADPLDGPPYTTVKAWTIADGRTGEVLWGHREKETLEMASTTKIMTAFVVVRLMAKDSKVGDERVTFSRRADRTSGSSSDVHEGESVPVRELLYGLLLPSGNDAAVAFAEHFGGRLEPPAGAADKTDAFSRFIAEMNRVAAELDLRETHFENPNGLPAKGHHSSARDLARLASLALKLPAFATVVSTPRHACTLMGGDGKSREVVWKNTNHLLEIEGYDGVKTGTTNAAGTCLVASGRRGGDHLIVVVLGGSSSPDSRYPDARNLFRWGWRMRGHHEGRTGTSPSR